MDQKLYSQIEATADLPVLGHFVWWGLRDCSIKHSDLVDHFKSIGIPEYLLIDEPSDESAFMKACAKANNTIVDGKTFLVRLIFKDKDRIVVGGVAEDKDNETLNYSQDFKIILNRLDGTAFVAQGQNKLADEIIASYLNTRQKHDTYNMCRQVLDVVRSAKCLFVRDRGGIYFCLDQHKELLLKLEQLVAELNLGNLYVLPQIDLAKTREAISKVFLANTVSDIETFQKEIKVWDDKNPHQKSLDNAGTEIDLLKEKIKAYSRVLKVDVSEFVPQISELESGIKKISQRKIKVQ